MRWFVTALLALVLAWLAYLASPYWAMYRLAAAVERGDLAAVAARVNPRALRLSLARQVAADFAEAAGQGGVVGTDTHVAAGIATALGDPILRELVAPSGVVQLLLTGPAGTPDGAPIGGEPVSWEDLDDYLSASSWRGFRNVYFALPPGEPTDTRFRLQLRFGRLAWRLVGVELPPALRRRISEGVLKRRG